MPRRVASAIIALGIAVLMAGCTSGNDGGPKGSLTIEVAASGAPAGVVTIAGVEARMSNGTWLPLETGLPNDVDLVALTRSGMVATLPAALLPEGDYDALELRITRVSVSPDGAMSITIPPPESGWTVRIPVSYSVLAGHSTTVRLKLRCGKSFSRLEGQFEFDPDIEVEGIEHGG